MRDSSWNPRVGRLFDLDLAESACGGGACAGLENGHDDSIPWGTVLNRRAELVFSAVLECRRFQTTWAHGVQTDAEGRRNRAALPQSSPLSAGEAKCPDASPSTNPCMALGISGIIRRNP